MIPSADDFLSVDFNKDLFPQLCPDRKEYPLVAEFAEWGKGEGDENFAKIWKRRKHGSCHIGR